VTTASPLAAPVLAPPTAVDGRPRREMLAYGALGAPLAMMALPVYVLVPKFYFEATGLSLAIIGAVLLLTRLADAFIDPFLGAWVDRSKRRGSYLRPVLIAMPPLVLGFVFMLMPPGGLGTAAATAWLAVTLAAAYLGYSLASVAYQAWGAELAHTDHARARVAAWREGAGLVGVIAASVIPYALGAPSLVALFLVSLAVALVLLVRHAPRPAAGILAGRVLNPAESSHFFCGRLSDAGTAE